MKSIKMKRCYGFTLAEVFITLAIMGVVAALSIPAVISNSQQQEFKTGLRKAVSVLNSAITMNMALDGESPYDNANLFGYLQKHMAIVESTTLLTKFAVRASNSSNDGYLANAVFYTTDGMRFEFNTTGYSFSKPLYENSDIEACGGSKVGSIIAGDMSSTYNTLVCNGCGSYGLNGNSDKTTKPPCLIMVDVNGDKKPNPANINCSTKGNAESECMKPYKYSDPLGLKLTDLFTIMITDKQAIPYGVAAQRAMYQARK